MEEAAITWEEFFIGPNWRKYQTAPITDRHRVVSPFLGVF
jgi:hypothetical protein